jgi:hypothetical protein
MQSALKFMSQRQEELFNSGCTNGGCRCTKNDHFLGSDSNNGAGAMRAPAADVTLVPIIVGRGRGFNFVI